MPGPGLLTVSLITAVAVVLLMLAFWGWSIFRRDVGVVDIAWGLGFVLVAGLAFTLGDATGPRRFLVPALVAVWGLRLSGFIAWRNLVARLYAGGETNLPEDRRYGAIRRKYGQHFWWISLFRVFGLRGALLWLISLPVLVMQSVPGPAHVGFTDYAGIALFLAGLFVETVSDTQLFSFRLNPGSHGQVLTTGLWRFSRHPNYFGDAMAWWGIFIVTAGSGLGVVATAVSPLLLTIMLTRAARLAGRDIGQRRPEYDIYAQTTSAFFPWLPRKSQWQTAPVRQPARAR
ncbi:MAG: DUF1295 domain-containing protein [Oligoflexia bacterium]|nr:DUF1295 domain-containing protein [Oligoflexia bacterium]